MRFIFQLRYHTRQGQSLFLTGNHELFGNGDPDHALPLHYLNHEFWQLSFELPPGAVPDAKITLNYLLRDADGSLVFDAGRDRVINLASFSADEVLFLDSWNDTSYYENAFYTQPFRQVLLKHKDADTTASDTSATHTFKVKAPLLKKTETLCLLGSNQSLHDWNTHNPILLSRPTDDDYYSAALNLSGESFPIAYKYGVYDLERKKFIRYENGENRILWDSIGPGKHSVLHDGFAVLPSTTWKGAGVAIPVFSLRSESSFGIGEFTDLKLLADWCAQVGLKLIQILPVNDTTATHTWTDSYPYAAISAFALNPVYLNLHAVANTKNRALLKKLEPERKRLNSLDTLDHEAVAQTKRNFVKQIFESQKDATFRSREYREFFADNHDWLVPYSAFCHLRDKFGTADFTRWPEHQTYDEAAIARFSTPDSPAHEDIALNYFIQFHLDQQLRDATEYAHSRGVVIKGDIPIGIYRLGADAWRAPELYHMDVQTGAPPDDFGIRGQNWGFPTYDWQRMRANGYLWWKQRFEQMGCYFDAFRIDHILGFFRIWSIPMDAVEGILGYFDPAIPVHRDEFRERGIPFDFDRYTKPFINDTILEQSFGPDTEFVKGKFLTSSGGLYSPRPEFATQRLVETHFAVLPDNPRNQKLKLGLYELISNVMLFEVSGSQGQQFHFRFAIENTSSFKALGSDIQSRLKELYVDYFFRRQEALWRAEAMEKLPALKRVTNMLICGEDLGLVPACVPDVMRQLGLLSLEIQRMPKDPKTEFFNPRNAPYLSVVTPSTHDMSTIRGWWTEDPERTQKFFNEELHRPGRAPATCEAWINQAIVRQHLESPAMWSIFQLQDLLGMDELLRRKNPEDERINEPVNSKHYWRYRMHLTLEALNMSASFNSQLSEQLRQSGR